MTDTTRSKVGFDRLLLTRFRCIFPILFPRLCARTSLLFFLLLTLGILYEFLAYQMGIVPSRFYSDLGKKDRDGFYSTFLEASLYIVAIAIAISAKQYISSFLYICWRKLLVKRLHNLYFLDKAYYILNVLDKHIDNPDQRITQDVDKMCAKLSINTAVIIIAPFKIGYYSYQSFTTTTYIGPLSIFAYFLVGTVISKLIMSPVISYVVKQERREGDFRFKHMQIRSNAESLAFHDFSSDLEKRRLNGRLHSLLAVQLTLANMRLGLNFFLNFYNYFGGILSHLILSIPIFAGSYDYLTAADLSALISANAFVSIYLISSFTELVSLSSDFTEIFGTAHRIGELLEKLSDRNDAVTIHTEGGGNDGDTQLLSVEPDVLFQLKHVTLTPPGSPHHILVRDLDLTVRRHESILIFGPSSCGKSSVLRLLAGLWPVRDGVVERQLGIPVAPSDALFLPQKSYFTDGSLWQQVAFPLETDGILGAEEAAKIKECLVLSGSEKILERVSSIDEEVDWAWCDVLSPGEQQRLVFARLFYHRPKIAFLDEGTSAVSMTAEEELYRGCHELRITLVSVGHRTTLRKYHDKILELDGEGGWQLRELSEKEADSSTAMEKSDHRDP